MSFIRAYPKPGRTETIRAIEPGPLTLERDTAIVGMVNGGVVVRNRATVVISGTIGGSIELAPTGTLAADDALINGRIRSVA